MLPAGHFWQLLPTVTCELGQAVQTPFASEIWPGAQATHPPARSRRSEASGGASFIVSAISGSCWQNFQASCSVRVVAVVGSGARALCNANKRQRSHQLFPLAFIASFKPFFRFFGVK